MVLKEHTPMPPRELSEAIFYAALRVKDALLHENPATLFRQLLMREFERMALAVELIPDGQGQAADLLVNGSFLVRLAQDGGDWPAQEMALREQLRARNIPRGVLVNLGSKLLLDGVALVQAASEEVGGSPV